MTTSAREPRHHPDAPEVVIAETISAAAGQPIGIPVTVRHRGARAARVRVTVFGLDARWIPEPLDLGVLQPGESTAIRVTVVPERGAMGARYPFTIAAESMVVDGRARPVVGVAESVLALDAAERVSMTIQPPLPSAVFSKRIRVDITNPSETERTFTLLPDSVRGIAVRLRHRTVTVPPQRTTSVKGRVRIRKPTIAGGHDTHTFTIAARGTGAPEYAEAALRATPLIGGGVRKVVGLVLVVALWIGLAIVFIPKISDHFKQKNDVAVSQVAGGDGGSGDGGDGSAGADGAPGSGGAESGGGSGSGGSGDDGDGAAGDGAAGGYQLSGTVTGPAAEGTSVRLTAVSLAGLDDGSLPEAQSSDESSGPKAFRSAAADAIGKLVGPMPAAVRDSFRTTTLVTGEKGDFTFSGVTAPGYYLLTVGQAGFQTQRFLINSQTLAAPQPLKIELTPGDGSLSGRVAGPDGSAIGAATIVVTDGTVTLQTSSVSASTNTGTPGTWSLDQVSTPGTYLVTATAPGYGGTSQLVELGASGTSTVNLTLVAGQGAITGTVSGEDELGQVGGLGGITVTATGDDVTRTATTVTAAAMRGTFVLPNLPAPGTYTLTISGPGYQTQTRDVALGAGTVTVNATLSRADGVISGMVSGRDENGQPEGGLGGVGLTLASNELTFKAMTTSGDSAGSFQFVGVPPGSYVLTATQFGRVSDSAAVELKAAGSKRVNLLLQADIGAELPATAHIRGQVTDSRTSGPLTCDRSVTPVAASDCVATVTVTAPKDPANPSAGDVTYTAKATSALNFVYTIPDLDDPDHAGLPPGLYTVRISAPGYESAVTHVQVAQGQTMPAPPVSMPALGIISGTISTRVGTPPESCVIAVPVGVTVPKDLPTSCTTSSDGNTCTATGISGAHPCAKTSTGGTDKPPVGTYQVRGLKHGQYQMVLIPLDPANEYVYTVGTVPIVTLELGADGQFNAVLDRKGRIELTVMTADPNTSMLIPVEGAKLTIAKYPGGAAVAIPDTTDSTGHATLTGLDGVYTVTATAPVTPADGGPPEIVTVSGRSAETALNQTVNMTLVVAKLSGPIVGRVTATIGNNTAAPVPGARVTISGVVGFAGGTSSTGIAQVDTDDNGCYAIVPEGWDSANNSQLTSPACGTGVKAGSIKTVVDLASGSQATLISDNIKVAVNSTWTSTTPPQPITDAYPSTDTTISDCPTDNNGTLCGNDKVRIVDTIPVTAQPMLVAPTLDVIGPVGFTLPVLSLSPSPVRIDTVSTPTLAGTVTLTPDGTTWTAPNSDSCVDTDTSRCRRIPLRFKDSQIADQNRVVPGRYQFSVSVNGFNPITIYLLCEFGQPGCVFVADAADGFGDAIRLAVKQKPALAVDISLPVSNGKYAADAWANAEAVKTTGGAVGELTVAADSPTTVTDDDTGTTTVTALNAHLEFDGKRSVLAPSPGTYTFAISNVKGYGGSTTIALTCGIDFTEPCTVTSTDAAEAYPTFDSAGSTVALDEPAAPDGTVFDFDDITATVTPNDGGRITLSVEQKRDGNDPALDGNSHVFGHVTWADSTPGLLDDQVVPVSYTVVFSLPGFADSDPVTVNCTSGGACQTGPVTLKRLPQASGTLTIPLAKGATSVSIPANAIAVTSPAGSTVKVTAPSTVSGTAGSNVTAPLTWVDSAIGVTGLVPAADYTVTVTLDGYQPAEFHCDATADDCTMSATLELNPNPDMQLTILPDNDTNTVPTVSVDGGNGGVTVTSNLGGVLVWKQSPNPDGVVTPREAPYKLRVQLDGYQVSVGGQAVPTGTPVDFTCDETGCNFPPIVLTKNTDLVVKLADQSGSAVQPRARVTLTRGGGDPSSAITPDGSATFNARSTTGVAESGGTWSDGTYELAVSAEGYVFASDLDADSSIVSCSNGGTTVAGLRLIPGGTTTCTVTLTALAAISGTAVWDAAPLPDSTASPAVTPLTGVTLTATRGDVTVTATAVDGVQGNEFTLTGMVKNGPDNTPDDIEGLTAGTWAVTASPDGYEPLSGTVTIGCVDAPAPDPDDDPTPVPVSPDADGHCSTEYTIAGVATDSDSTSYLKQSGQSIAVHFVPAPVKLTVQFVNNQQTATLQAGTLTLTSEVGGSWTCTMPDADDDDDECAIASDKKSLSFTQVPPGHYTIDVTFTDGKFSSIVGRAVEVVAGQDLTESLPVTARINTVSGFVKDSAGTVIPGATVKLCDAAECPAKDYDGHTSTMATTSSSANDANKGKFTFSNVADGTYHLVVTKSGYADNTGGNFTVSFDESSPPTHNVVMLAPTRQTLSMTFGAPSGLSLAGASVTLTQTNNNGRLSTDGPLTASTITGAGTTASPYTSTLSQVPTGTYDVSVLMGSSQAPFAFPAGSVGVTQGIDTQNESLGVQAATVTVTADWTNADLGCVSAPTAAIPLQIKIGLDGELKSIGSTGLPASGATSADRVVYLPTGTYYARSNATGWQTPNDLKLVLTSAPGTSSGTVTITPVTTEVTLAVTTDGQASEEVTGTVTASCTPSGGSAYTKTASLSSASDTIVLPGSGTSGWTFTLSGTVDGQTVTDLAGTLSGSTVTFDVESPPAPPATVSLGVTVTVDGAATIPSGFAMTLTGPDPTDADGTSKDFSGAISGSTVTFEGLKPGSTYTVAASSTAVATYNSTTTSLTTTTADGTDSVAFTSPTASVTVTVKTSIGAALASKTVEVTLVPDDGTCGTTTNANGEVTCTGLKLSTSYTVEVTWDDNGTDHTGQATFSTNDSGSSDGPPTVTPTTP